MRRSDAHRASSTPLNNPGLSRAPPAALALLAFIPRGAHLAHCLLPSPSLLACRPCSPPPLLRRSPPPCSLLAHHAPGIAHNHLAAVHSLPEPPPLATAVPDIAQ
ncbi:hypothetical protein B0H11DRAFT_2233826 [Mycena galericulata]|nr:hypothetical protein B0H11DRAFT_2233826 [Mycena galericulata]